MTTLLTISQDHPEGSYTQPLPSSWTPHHGPLIIWYGLAHKLRGQMTSTPLTQQLVVHFHMSWLVFIRGAVVKLVGTQVIVRKYEFNEVQK
jgi:hypothetical protein